MLHLDALRLKMSNIAPKFNLLSDSLILHTYIISLPINYLWEAIYSYILIL